MSEISDILETLEKLEVIVLNYEDSIKRNNEDSSLVHHIFRNAHNLKSTLAMAQKNYSSKLIHITESSFDLIRKGMASPPNELIQNCLLAIDLIKTNVQQDEECILDLEAQTKQLEIIFNNLKKGTKEILKIDLKLTEEQFRLFQQLTNEGYYFYQIEKMIKTDIGKTIFDNLPIYDDLKEIGRLILSEPRFDDLPRKEEEAILKIFFSSKMGEKELENYIFDPYKSLIINAIEHKSSNKLIDEKENTKQEPKLNLPNRIKTLIVDDDIVSTSLIKNILSQFGTSDVVFNGREAVLQFEKSLKNNDPYNLICMDIKMPMMDGQQALKMIRQLEESYEIHCLSNTKIVMITSINDAKNKVLSFTEQCDGYILKPIAYNKIIKQLKKLELIQ